MKEFSLLGFAEHLGGLVLKVGHEQHAALEAAVVVIETEAKEAIGHYQAEAEPFAAWDPLADATKAERVALGYPEDEPELRSGELRDSIQHTAGLDEAVVGSDSDIMVYQELGTSHMPPRSILGGAAVRKTPEVLELIGGYSVAALIGVGRSIKIR